MTDGDQTVIFSLNGGYGELNRLGVDDDFTATENQPTDFAPGLVSLGFLATAVRRSAWLVFAMTVIGLLVGAGMYVGIPRPYQASATLLLTLSPYEDSQSAPGNNQAIAETRAVAEIAVHALGLQQSVSSFVSSYTVTSLTDRVLTVTASGPSADQAELRANAVAGAFLTFRATELQAEQNLVVESLDQQINLTKQRISSIGAQISQLSGQLASSTQRSQLNKLQAAQTSAAATLGTIQETLTGNQTTTQAALTAALKTSQILSVAPLTRSRLKPLIIYVAIGFVIGLALALGLVILRALVSDRLRQRDDIAYALDAPVKLSVGTLRVRRFPPTLRGLAKRDLDMKRVIAYLQGAVPRSTRGQAGLAIVAVDNAPVVARAVAALAASCASQGQQVIAVDLSRDAHLAHLLRVKAVGAREVRHNGVSFVIAVPSRDDAAPIGPLRAMASPTGPAPASDALAASCASADVLLTLVTLDPALGGDHLATWATSAVVAVSAGQSSAERVHGVGEMIRLAGTRLDSIVLIGADRNDESLGLAPVYSRATA